MRKRYWILIISGLLLFLSDLLLGSMSLDFKELLTPDTLARTIVLDFRLPKAITALLVGAALALSGLLMQTVFRNPLAGPYVLGVSSGSSLAVALFMLGSPIVGMGIGGQIGLVTSAWVGSVAVLMVVMAAASRLKDIMAVLILGMMVGSVCSALVELLQFFSSEAALKGFVLWTMGSLGGLTSSQLGVLFVTVVVGTGLSISSIKGLDLLLLGENYARTMGLNVARSRVLIFGATSLLAGGVTAFCGPIAFIGIAAPHVARLIFRRADHRVMLPASVLVGVNMMLLCDVIAGLPFSEMVLPINTVASLMGIPIVIMVVLNGGKTKIM
ncbi:MAG: iron ABC transporter permease [Mucinivorans sp.]